MKTKQLLFLALLLFCLSAKAAVIIPGGGSGGGVTVSAGATNGIAMLDGFGTNTTIMTLLTVDGVLKATNDNIILGNEGKTISFGESLDNLGTFTNNHVTYQNSGFTMNVAGGRALFQDTVTLEVQNGSSLQVGTSTAIGTAASFIRLGTNDYVLFDGHVDPVVDSVGELNFETDAWAASRGALKFHDGTAATLLLGVLASDTPSNGQVPKWNTGGTITWEDDTGGSGTPIGGSTAIQLDRGGALFGTNGALEAFTYTNGNVRVQQGGGASYRAIDSNTPQTNLFSHAKIGSESATAITFISAGTDRFVLGNDGHLTPFVDNTYNFGSDAARWIGTFSTLSNNVLVKPSIRPPGAGGLVHFNGTNDNAFASATTNMLIVLTNFKAGVNYTLAVSNGANVVVTLSNAAAIKVPGLPAGQFPAFNTNGFTYMTFRIDDISGSTNLVAFSSKERSLIVGNGFLMTTNAVTDEVSIWGGHFTNSVVTGVGGANTNFTLNLPYDLETTVNGFTNVSIRAVMGYDATRVIYWNLMITNYSGSDRTLEFSAVTNRWRFSGVYGTNAPSVLTNQTALLISGRSHGTNTQVGYTSFPGPL